MDDGKKDLLNDRGEIILSGFENYDITLNLIFAQKDGKWRLYDRSGTIVLEQIYDEILNPEMPDGYKVNGLVRVKSGGLWGAIDQNGIIIIQPQFDFIHLTYYEEVEPFIKVEKDGKFGYVTRAGKPLVDTVWDKAFMDVLTVPEDIIFVKADNKWGGIRVNDASAMPVDWNLQPSDEAKLSFNDWKYSYQGDFYTHQIINGETDITAVTMLFFNDYFSKNHLELRILPNFPLGGTPRWHDLSDYMIGNTSDQWADGFMTKEQFDKNMMRFFGNINYTYEPGWGLIYKDGKYISVGGFSLDGSLIYELTNLERGKTQEGKDTWKANIKGYYFRELDGSFEDIQNQSKNAQVVWAEMKKEDNIGLDFWQVREHLVFNDPGSKLDVVCEWVIEFTVNDPLGDIYFTYLSCDSNWVN